ncbi:hypothetical protein EF879_13035 [Micromonospora sp. HM5-17]|jgi:hypothetical protein|nr:hypothetical protein EF879_13035 [Micromonospora sp. HM5-17]
MFLPLLVSVDDTRYGAEHLLEGFTPDLAVAYSFGPPYGSRFVTWDDLDRLHLGRRTLRRVALDNLHRLLPKLRIDGQPPAPMLSFGGLESSVLLVDEVWVDLSRSVPGELVVGVPARDVVIFTGTGSRPGLAKVRRAVDRIFFAGGQHLLSQELLVWQDGWSAYQPGERLDALADPGPAGRTPPGDRAWGRRTVGAAAEPGREPYRWSSGGEPHPPTPARYRLPRQRTGDPGPAGWPEPPPPRRPARWRDRPGDAAG